YLSRGYIVNTHVTSVSPVPNGASETLEYALDDFSIARLARAIGDGATARTFLLRSQNWSNLFDTATGWIAPRGVDGGFEQTPITDNGQSGFQEGNAAQYTWMVPQDLADLIRGIGGRAATVARLDAFFSQINAGQNHPYAWLGNEPSLGSPWVYLSAGEPWRTQAVVRDALDTLYTDTPAGLPGNDDLGEMSAWYVWSAIGLYPQNPSVRVLDIGSPLFAHVVVRSPGGPTIAIDAPAAADDAPYVQSLRVDGKPSQRTWVALPMQGTLALAFTLGASPNRAWGTATQDAPPSYSARAVAFPAPIDASSGPAPAIVQAAPPGRRIPIAYVENYGDNTVTPVDLHARVAGAPIAVGSGPRDAALDADGTRLYVADRNSNQLSVVDTIAGKTIATVAVGNAPSGTAITPDGKTVWVANSSDNTVQPIDTATLRAGTPIAVGASPRDIVVAPDGNHLYVTDQGGDGVTSVDLSTRAAQPPIVVGSKPTGITISPDGKTLYVANNGSGTVTIVDLATATTRVVPAGIVPQMMAFSSDGGTLYVTNYLGYTVTPIDLATGRARASIRVGGAPDGIVRSPDGTTLWIVMRQDNALVPLDLATGTVGTPIPVGGTPLSIAAP
ncbi:MAG TPA: glycoside hydrolase domain-containing protein, partial [Candidatus Baltobacteraceae bacterium]